MLHRRHIVLLTLALFVALCATQAQPIVVGAARMEVYLPQLQDRRIAIVGNHTSLVGHTHLVDTLTSQGIHLAKIFCPEHGFRGTADAGASIANSNDPSTGIPIVSLYGKNKKPQPEHLDGIDLVLFDLQDVGCRFYTYISTLQLVMEACAEQGIPLLLLDRPNPNGHYVDGPVLEKQFTSFVGMRAGTPIVYGMTIGEYATMLDSELTTRKEGYTFDVVPLLNYTHDSIYRLPVPPSPNLRTPQAIALYPSLCLLEGTTISVGRGTPYPFEIIGNQYKQDLRNVASQPQLCLDYLRAQLAHSDTSSFFLKNNFFELLAGTASLRQQLLRGDSDDQIRASWQPQLDAFCAYRKQFLLYPEH